ncbi:MAG: glycosyltransferase, partial [Xanthobacteraceae bacterium]
MLSVVIATHDSERALLPTLAGLVAGAAAGVVRDVVIADAGSRDATGAIADGAGCHVLISAERRGVRL